jgi:hypothetical protein
MSSSLLIAADIGDGLFRSLQTDENVFDRLSARSLKQNSITPRQPMFRLNTEFSSGRVVGKDLGLADP